MYVIHIHLLLIVGQVERLFSKCFRPEGPDLLIVFEKLSFTCTCTCTCSLKHLRNSKKLQCVCTCICTCCIHYR